MLLIAYVFYILGGILAGAGFAFWGVLLGRGLCGVGNAGITVLISTLIVGMFTDAVTEPRKFVEVARYLTDTKQTLFQSATLPFGAVMSTPSTKSAGPLAPP